MFTRRELLSWLPSFSLFGIVPKTKTEKNIVQIGDNQYEILKSEVASGKIVWVEYIITDQDGNKHWFLNGQLHRDHGPAVEYLDGRKNWYQHGKLHRLDGPAVEQSNGSKYYYKDGKCYKMVIMREDGPVIKFC